MVEERTDIERELHRSGDVDVTSDNKNLLSAAQRTCREANLKRLADTKWSPPSEDVASGALARID